MKVLYVRSICHSRQTINYVASCIWKYMLPTGLIHIALLYLYSLKQFHISVAFGFRCSKTPSFWDYLKQILPVDGRGNLLPHPLLLDASCLIRRADQVQFDNSPLPSCIRWTFCHQCIIKSNCHHFAMSNTDLHSVTDSMLQRESYILHSQRVSNILIMYLCP